jgi:hypothetical protein
MSTRCTIHFQYNGHTEAIVYRHSDGYPGGEYGVLADLRRFFDEVEAQTNDTRFSDPPYLAAKFVVWQAEENSDNSDPEINLDFLGVGVVLEDPGDIEWRYFVDYTLGSRPAVNYERA